MTGHHKREINVCTKFHGNLSNSHRHFTPNNKCEPQDGAKGKAGDHHSHQNSLSGTINISTRFHGNLSNTWTKVVDFSVACTKIIFSACNEQKKRGRHMVLDRNNLQNLSNQIQHITVQTKTSIFIQWFYFFPFGPSRALTGHTRLLTPVTCIKTCPAQQWVGTSLGKRTQRVFVGLGSGQNNVPLSCKQQTGQVHSLAKDILINILCQCCSMSWGLGVYKILAISLFRLENGGVLPWLQRDTTHKSTFWCSVALCTQVQYSRPIICCIY